MKKTATYLILLFLLSGISRPAFAQTEFSAGRVSLDTQKFTINIEIKALFKGRPMSNLNPKGQDFKVLEILPGKLGDTLVPLRLDTLVRTRRATALQEKLNVVFLLDLSANMDSNAVRQARAIINTALLRFPPNESSNFFLVAGLQKSERVPLNPANPEPALATISGNRETPDLYHAIIQQMRFLRRLEGKQVLIILSNGKNRPANSLDILPDVSFDVLRQASTMGLDFFCFPIGLGSTPDELFFKELIAKTKNPEDNYTLSTLPINIDGIIKNSLIYESTHILSLYPQNSYFQGEIRKYEVWLESNKLQSETSYHDLHNSSNPYIFKPTQNEEILTLTWFLGGVVILVGFYGMASLSVPMYRRYRFRKKYVQQYLPKKGIRQFDPLTKEQLREGEWVVAKCRQPTPLATWNGLGQCPNYPDCMHFHDPCSGSGAPEPQGTFFSMQGIYRKLNWVWFGALGGFTGWLIFSTFKYIDFGWYRALTGSVISTLMGSQAADTQELVNLAQGMANNTLVGIAFAIGLISVLSWMTERAQSRAFSFTRVLLRTLVGVAAAALVFIIGFHIQYQRIIPGAFTAGMVTWLLFGAVTGMALSLRSSISLVRGMLGGILACLIGYLLFSWLGSEGNIMGARLIGWVILGAVLGLVVETVYTTLEEFELEIISPTRYRHTVHISKWLKSSLSVIIGREPGSFVYVKWADPVVELQHARLTLDRAHVYLEPFAETLVNGHPAPLNKRTRLQNGDLIQLGPLSVSRFKYVEKRKEVRPPQPTQQPAHQGDKLRILGGKPPE